MLEKLNDYKYVTLEDIKRFNIKNRKDTRYVLNKEKALEILNNISDEYSILEIEGDRVIGYETSYYDTKDFDFFNNHINNSSDKLNIRIRSYSTSLYSNMDIKESKNGNRVNKIIERYDSRKSFDEFIEKHTSYDAFSLEEKVAVHFNRFTFVNLETKEKITIDLDLGFTTLNSFQSLPTIAIIEIKSEKSFYKSSFKKLLKKFDIKPNPISKYCLAISMMYSNRTYLSMDFYNKFSSPSQINAVSII